MKITATKADDIRKARDEYDAVLKTLADKEKEQEDKYDHAMYLTKNDVEKRVSDLIGPTTLNLQIRVDPYGRSLGQRSWTVRVEVDKYNNNAGLAWNWEVSLDGEGNIVKDSGSWSGLKAVTTEDIEQLEESVRIIKLLNNIDWHPVLNTDMPSWNDYIDKENWQEYLDKKKVRPDFEDQLISARLEELIDQNTAIKLESDEYYRGPVGMLVTGLTDKFVKGYIFPWSYVSNKSADELRNYAGSPRRTARNKLVIKNGELEEVNVM